MNMIFIVIARKESDRVLKELRALCGGKLFASVSDAGKYAGGYGIVK